MCGRFALATEKHLLEMLYDFEKRPDLNLLLLPRYNIAPGQKAAVLRLNPHNSSRELVMLKWGLVPFWAKEPGAFKPLINARAETVAFKPAFREALKKRRALVPASGFYEWKEEQGAKQPYYITRRDKKLFSVAALWESRRQGEEESLQTFALITTAACSPISALHERMPVIISEENYTLWLDGRADSKVLQNLLEPAPAEDFYYYPVDKKVNSPLNEGSALIELTVI